MAFTYFIALFTALCLAFPALADDFKNFRIPPHEVFGLSGQVSGNGRTTSNNSPNGKYTNGYWNGSLSLTQFWLKESDAYRAYIRSSGSFNGSYVSSKSRTSTSDTSRSAGNGKDRGVSENASLSWDGWAYPWAIPAGISGSLSSSVNYQQSWGTSVNSDHYPTASFSNHHESERWDYYYQASATVGVGWGRVRDATGVYNTYLAEQRLRDLGVITGGLSAETRRQVAELYYRSSDFKAQHERNQRYFWREVERLLKHDPAVNGAALDAYSLNRIAEPINGRSYYRERGFFIGPVARGSHYNDIAREYFKQTSLSVYDTFAVTDTLQYISQRDTRTHDEFMLGGSLEYHLPIGPLWQIDLESEALFPARQDDEDGLALTSRVNVAYVIADRWRAYGMLSHNRNEQSYLYFGRWSNDSWNVRAAAGLTYYIEDRMSITGLLEQYQGFYWHNDDSYVQPDEQYTHQTSVSLSLVYHFAGIGGFTNDYYNDGPRP